MDLIDAKTIFTPASGFILRGGFQWTCNPYVGCTFGCSYCYASYLPQNRRPVTEWGRWLSAKQNAVACARKQARVIADQAVYMSSVTDPYLPAERTLQLSRGILEEMLPFQPRLVVQTRGPLVVRDIDLLQQFQWLRVNISIPTDSEAIRQQFEPKAPTLEQRWLAAEELRAAKIDVGLCVTPTLPLKDMQAFIDRLARFQPKVLVIQEFHDSRGHFGAHTGEHVRELAEQLLWHTEHYLEFREGLQSRMRVFEGEAGFFPPPRMQPHMC